ncbi:hypothetical protein BZG02_18415 [Labilibaculum filiforme]|uniref:DUF2812 domain-containing protein n=1 Tax=Labilibaculum filiforme TaxID=1940526 RepID=A0A2N3HRP8_9BACT|nr:hypothetical protein [Labilibaculum filiforme]PKQ60697.1 hypothetical protein BZG02_18415 [Labilibaculum filiforme]
MKKLIGFNIKRNKKLLVSDIIKFYEVRGYTLMEANAQGMTFHRGSNTGYLLSLNPIKWKTRVEIEIIKKERLDYNVYACYHFSSFLFFISQEENDFFNEEIAAFSKAIEQFEVDVEQLENLAKETSKSNFNYILKSFPIGIILALLIIFTANLLMEGQLPNIIASCITGFSILICYYLLVKTNSKT